MAEYFFAQKPDVSFGLQILQAIIHVFCCSYFSRRSVLYSVFWLLFEKSCGEVDVFGCNLVASKPLRQVFSIIKAERFIRTFSVQFLSPVGLIWFIISSTSACVSSSKLLPFGRILRINSCPTSISAFWYGALGLQ